MTDQDSAGEGRQQGFWHPVRSTFALFSSALHTRLELFATELEEERERLKQTLVLTLLLFFGLSLGFILLNIFIVAILWQAGWVYALGAMAALYLGIGIGAGLLLRDKHLTRPGLFPATLAELAKDRDRLRSNPRE
jgi:uncharacterized membrane protein YqjE